MRTRNGIILATLLTIGLAAPVAVTPATAAPAVYTATAPSHSAAERTVLRVKQFVSNMTLRGFPVSVNAETKRIEAQVESLVVPMRRIVLDKDISVASAQVAVAEAIASTADLIAFVKEYKAKGAKFNVGGRTDTISAKIKNKTVAKFDFSKFMSRTDALVTMLRYSGQKNR